MHFTINLENQLKKIKEEDICIFNMAMKLIMGLEFDGQEPGWINIGHSAMHIWLLPSKTDHYEVTEGTLTAIAAAIRVRWGLVTTTSGGANFSEEEILYFLQALAA